MSTLLKPRLTLLLLCMSLLAHTQTKKVLFLGNSYTYVNNLPQMVGNMAASTGNTLIYDSNTPGGYSLGNHKLNAVSISKIQAGGWDHVVLQEQSQTYAFFQSFPYVFPNACYLDSLIKVYSACEQTMFYMTWGYKNGDSYLCTFPECDSAHVIDRTCEQMDSVIHTNYMFAGDSLKAIVSPVGAVWRYIRQHYPAIDLYSADGSHPSAAGTYAAACCFYTAIFRKDPALIGYTFTLSVADAALIRQATQQVVFNDLLHWGIGAYDTLETDSCLTLGVLAIQTHPSLHVYPNPAGDIIHIELKDQQNQIIRIYNALGVMVKETPVISFTTINIHTWPSGLYFLNLDNEPQVFKFVKQ